MDDNDLYKTIKFIEGYYNRKIENNEIVALKDELKDYTYETFLSELKYPLLKKVDYFKVQALHRIIEDDKELQDLKERLEIKSFDELYEN